MALENASWDELRKKARRLENEIDVKLAGFGRMNQAGDDARASEAELEQLLEQLQRTNSSMQSLINAAGSDIVSHTLARHLNIFQELSQEFRRKRSAARADRQHSELLSSFGSSVHNSSRDLEANLYVQEQSAIGQVDSVLNQAQATFSSLAAQRSYLGSIGTKSSAIGSMLPSVGHLLTAIRRRKNRDTVILSAVISVCTFLIFLYWISK